MSHTVLLQHTLDDGSFHYDWMLQRPGNAGPADGNGLGLITFRVQVRIDARDCTAFEAERIGDHRAAYLTHEGPVSGGRPGAGYVRRVAAGVLWSLADHGDRLVAEVDWGMGVRLVRGRRIGGEAWHFEAELP